MKQIYTRIFAAAAASLITLSALSCGNDEKLLESSKEEQTVVMTIDGYDVPMELYRYVALNAKAEEEKAGAAGDIWLGEEGQQRLDALYENVDDILIRLYTPLSLCRTYGIDPESEFFTDTLQSSMNIIYEEYENDYKAYNEYLQAYNMNDSVYRFFIRNDIIAEELINAMFMNGDIPTETEELRTIIAGDAFIRVKQILIPNDNGKTAEENYRQAEEVYQKVLNGEDFDTLVQTYGGDLFMFSNPDGYYMCKGTYQPAFEEAAFALEIGEVSGIVETNAGYSIIRRYEKEDSYLEKHFDDLADMYAESRYNLILEAHEAKLTVTDTDALSDYPLFNLSMTDED